MEKEKGEEGGIGGRLGCAAMSRADLIKEPVVQFDFSGAKLGSTIENRSNEHDQQIVRLAGQPFHRITWGGC
jgi:hypothetical protein